MCDKSQLNCSATVYCKQEKIRMQAESSSHLFSALLEKLSKYHKTFFLWAEVETFMY